MLVDSHAHLNFKAFSDDLDEVIKRCQAKKMLVINVGSQISTSKEATIIAHNYDGFFAAVGIHPIHLGESNLDPMEIRAQEEMDITDPDEMITELEDILSDKKVVAIGEVGLDYFHLSGDKEKTKTIQKKYFIKQLDLAIKNNLPVILHARGEKESPEIVYNEILDILSLKLSSPRLSRSKGVIHCFGSSLEIAKKFVDLGFYIGFTGIVTFNKKSEELQGVARELPLENIFIETDCPYLAPEPHRGERNEPIYVEFVAKKIAELKGIGIDEVIEKTGKNAIELFGLKK